MPPRKALPPSERMTTTLGLRRPAVLNDIEAEILSLYACGSTRAEIAAHIGLSAHTVGHYLTTAKDKLRARSLAHAVYLLSRAD